MAITKPADTGKLYTPTLLALSASLAQYPLTNNFPLRHELRSRSCGSVIELGLEIDNNGAISRVGMMVSACAVGQSSAAVFAAQAVGHTRAQIAQMVDDIENWLKGEGDIPAWPDFSALAAAKDHKGRHEALLLVWRAAILALSSVANNS